MSSTLERVDFKEKWGKLVKSSCIRRESMAVDKELTLGISGEGEEKGEGKDGVSGEA